MGWRGSARHWQRYEMAYLLLAGLATPLVLSVHTVVSFDFTVAIVPGWHSTILPAVLRGRRHLLRLCHGAGAGYPAARRFYGLEDLITDAPPGQLGQGHAGDRSDRGLRLLLESFTAWYSGNVYETRPSGTA